MYRTFQCIVFLCLSLILLKYRTCIAPPSAGAYLPLTLGVCEDGPFLICLISGFASRHILTRAHPRSSCKSNTFTSLIL